MITGTIEQSDSLAAHRLHRRPSKKLRRIYFVLSAVGIFGGAIALWLKYYSLGCAFIGAVVGGVIGEVLVRYLYVPWWVRRIYRQQKSLHDSFRYRWDCDALSNESSVGTVRRPWTQYLKWKENKDIFLIYHSDALCEMLPKRWFLEPKQINDFREHVQKYVVT